MDGSLASEVGICINQRALVPRLARFLCARGGTLGHVARGTSLLTDFASFGPPVC